jgi:hypothetical protein
MKLYKHENYDEYVEAQVKKNKLKLRNVWVKSTEIQMIANKIRTSIPGAKFGICHGVRNGYEVKALRGKLKRVNIIGTDISPTVLEYPNTIQWDFHKIKKEWINKVDFIYSNSFDHSYKPGFCLDQWMKCIRNGKGICFIHWMSTNKNKIDAADCFAGNLIEYRKLINKKYEIVEELGSMHRRLILIKHRRK